MDHLTMQIKRRMRARIAASIMMCAALCFVLGFQKIGVITITSGGDVMPPSRTNYVLLRNRMVLLYWTPYIRFPGGRYDFADQGLMPNIVVFLSAENHAQVTRSLASLKKLPDSEGVPGMPLGCTGQLVFEVRAGNRYWWDFSYNGYVHIKPMRELLDALRQEFDEARGLDAR